MGLWQQEIRLLFIDGFLKHHKRINRFNIQNFFGVSHAQAANDMRDYLILNGDGLTYDTKKKTYRATESWKPLFRHVNKQYDLLQGLEHVPRRIRE